MKKHFNCTLLYSDTDSLLYEISTDDLYADLQRNPELQQYFDFSNYDKKSALYNESNKRVTLKFKDEMQGGIISEFVGLKPKMYSIQAEGNYHCLNMN